MDPYTIARLAREKEMEIRREAYKEYWDDPRLLESMFRSGQTLTWPERALKQIVDWICCCVRPVWGAFQVLGVHATPVKAPPQDLSTPANYYSP